MNEVEVYERKVAIHEVLTDNPGIATKTAARILRKKYPLLFSNVEKARSAVRYKRGNMGDDNRKDLTDHTFVREGQKAGYTIQLPVSKAESWLPYDIDATKILVLCDIHVPYHDNEALEVALRFGDKYEPDCVLLNGDVGDHYSVSNFNRNPQLRNYPEEIKLIEQFLAHIRERFYNAQIIYKYGNHDERLRTYCWVKAPDLWGLPEVTLEHLLHLEEHDIEDVQDGRIIMAGRLPIVHGHEFRRAMLNPVNAARGLFLRANHTAMCGHYHQVSNHTEVKIDDKVMSTWSVGCLCDLHPPYSRLNKTWMHGFATIDLEGERFQVNNLKIINGEVR